MHEGAAPGAQAVPAGAARARAGQLRWDDLDPVPRRLRRSVGTFGPVGRVVATGLVCLFVAWFFFLGPFVFFLVPALPYVAWTLREIWSRAPVERGPEPTHAPDFSGVLPSRGRFDPVQPSLWTSWRPDGAGPVAADEPAAEESPASSEPSEPAEPDEPASEEERLAWAHLLDPRLAASLRDRPRVVPPPFPGDAARQSGAAGAEGAAGAAGTASGAPA